jgi:hypothetical protein
VERGGPVGEVGDGVCIKQVDRHGNGEGLVGDVLGLDKPEPFPELLRSPQEVLAPTLERAFPADVGTARRALRTSSSIARMIRSPSPWGNAAISWSMLASAWSMPGAYHAGLNQGNLRASRRRGLPHLRDCRPGPPHAMPQQRRSGNAPLR